MTYSEFVSEVQERIGGVSAEESRRAIEATLKTLSDRLGTREPNHLAQHLPEEFCPLLESEGSESFELQEFYRRVAERSNVSEEIGAERARHVVAVLCAAVRPGLVAELRAGLGPQSYKPLFEEAFDGAPGIPDRLSQNNGHSSEWPTASDPGASPSTGLNNLPGESRNSSAL